MKGTVTVYVYHPQGNLVERLSLRVGDIPVCTNGGAYLDGAVYRAVRAARNPDATSKQVIRTAEGQPIGEETHHMRYPAPVEGPYCVTVLDDAYGNIDAPARSLHDLVRAESVWVETLLMTYIVAAAVLGLGMAIAGMAFMHCGIFLLGVLIECAAIGGMVVYNVITRRRLGRIARAIQSSHDDLVETHIFRWDHVATLYQWMTAQPSHAEPAPNWMRGVPTLGGLMYYGAYDTGCFLSGEHCSRIRGPQ